MKKILILLILTMFSIFSIMADEASVYTSTSIRVDSMQTVRLSVTTSNTVFLGVAANEVNSSILPATIDSVTFGYNPQKMDWETPSVYFFVISFVKDKLQVTLKTPPYLENGTNKLYWTNVSSVSINPGSTDPVPLVTESSESTSPRVYSWEMKLVVDDISKIVPGEYSGTFVLQVAVV